MDFFLGFWREDSDYARMRKLQGRPLSRAYIANNASVIRKYLSLPLKDIRFHKLSITRMEKIVLDLAESGVNPRTINYMLQAVKVPASSWARKHRAQDPFQYLEKVAEHPRERGVLSLDEMGRIVNLEGESPRTKAAVLLGGLCGLRLGEARGLQWADVDEVAGLVHLVHNWIDGEGCKSPKCGSKRDVPLSAPVLEAVRLCRACAPADAVYVLYGEKNPERPIEKKTIERGFKRILEKIGIDESERKERNLLMHGLRHFFVTAGRVAGLNDFTIQRLAGHRTGAMMQRYSAHSEIIDIGAAGLAFDGALSGSIAKAAGK